MMSECIQGPAEKLSHNGITDAKSYVESHARIMSQRQGKSSDVEGKVSAYVNQGRWVVNCLCNGGCLTSPEFKIACCFDCGRVFRNVVFPYDARRIEQELLKRKSLDNRNWNGETVESLEAETRSGGIDPVSCCK